MTATPLPRAATYVAETVFLDVLALLCIASIFEIATIIDKICLLRCCLRMCC